MSDMVPWEPTEWYRATLDDGRPGFDEVAHRRSWKRWNTLVSHPGHGWQWTTYTHEQALAGELGWDVYRRLERVG